MGERVIFEWEGLWIKESRGARGWMGGWVRVDDRELVLISQHSYSVEYCLTSSTMALGSAAFFSSVVSTSTLVVVAVFDISVVVGVFSDAFAAGALSFTSVLSAVVFSAAAAAAVCLAALAAAAAAVAAATLSATQIRYRTRGWVNDKGMRVSVNDGGKRVCV